MFIFIRICKLFIQESFECLQVVLIFIAADSRIEHIVQLWIKMYLTILLSLIFA